MSATDLIANTLKTDNLSEDSKKNPGFRFIRFSYLLIWMISYASSCDTALIALLIWDYLFWYDVRS